jgi:L-seryl-tRNA(Ser) seleniumtransferase
MSYDKFGLKEVINASGKMTILGVSKVSESVLAAQRFGGEHFFEMSDLLIQTGAYLAELLKVEDAQIVSSASAGIAQSVAAVIGEGSLYHAYHPYTTRITKREILLPKGHNVDYGTPVEVMVSQGGGHVIEAGYANGCSSEQMEMMITENTAALLYIKSHHTVQKSMLTVTEAAAVAEKHRLPLIVDAAAEEDLFKYSQAGADLVIYSGAKALEGPSSGLVLGKASYIEWVRMQGKGIGRAMKIGKDTILGLTQAVEDRLKMGAETGESMKGRTQSDRWFDGIGGSGWGRSRHLSCQCENRKGISESRDRGFEGGRSCYLYPRIPSQQRHNRIRYSCRRRRGNGEDREPAEGDFVNQRNQLQQEKLNQSKWGTSNYVIDTKIL